MMHKADTETRIPPVGSGTKTGTGRYVRTSGDVRPPADATLGRVPEESRRRFNTEQRKTGAERQSGGDEAESTGDGAGSGVIE